MTTRRRAREIVLQLLYEDDLNPEQDPQLAEQFLIRRMHGNRPLVDFAKRLFTNVLSNRKELDKSLSGIASNWSLRRMAAIDRNILRLGAYEIIMTDTPGRVVINEAVELAKRYGDRQSGQFVNGVLDRVLHAQTETSETPPAGEAEAVAASAGETP
jgi:N utilization substance protein B